MANEKERSELEEFMGSLGNNANPADNQQNDPFNHLEKKEEEEFIEPKDEKPLPFNRDPKIQKYLDKREREIEERLASKFERETPRDIQPQSDSEVKEVLEELIGNDTPAKLAMVKKFENILAKGSQRARDEALEELEARQYQEVQADREAEEELENAFDSIEEQFDVDITSNNPIAKKTRQEFLSYVERIAPKDSNGDVKEFPDMSSAWEDFSERKRLTGTPNRAKELASRSMSRSSEASVEPVLKRGRPAFSNSDDFIESLSR